MEEAVVERVKTMTADAEAGQVIVDLTNSSSRTARKLVILAQELVEVEVERAKILITDAAVGELIVESTDTLSSVVEKLATYVSQTEITQMDSRNTDFRKADRKSVV